MLKRIRRFFQENRLFVLIVILAAVLRFIGLSDTPPSLNWDEISHGYNAYSILKTGKDEWGQSFPIIFRAYGDYKLPVYIYLTALSEYFFGLNAFAVRLLSVIAGIATVFFTYLLVVRLFKNKSLATVVSLLVAVEPWSLFLSRGAFEANLALAFIVSGVYFFLAGVKKAKYLPVSAILLGLSVWTYNSARVFVPILSIALGLIYKKEIFALWKKEKKSLAVCTLSLAAFLIPMFFQLVNPVGQARYGWVSILDEGAIAKINEARTASNLSPFLSRALHNKATYFSQRFVSNWLSHFSPKFLFLEGGSHYQFSVPGYGLLYPVNAVLLIIGLVTLFRKKDKNSKLLLVWFFVGPFGSSLTREAPHVLRSITMLPVPMIATGVGAVAVWNWLKKKRFVIPLQVAALTIYLMILGVSMKNYLSHYFTNYRSNYSWSWQYGYEQVVDYVKENYAEYDKIIITKKYGEPHEFLLFYWPWDPREFRDDPGLIRFYQSNWYWVDRFDKFYFVNDWEVPRAFYEDFVLESGGTVKCQAPDIKCLLITSPGNYPEGWIRLQAIDFLDGKPAFEIYKQSSP